MCDIQWDSWDGSGRADRLCQPTSALIFPCSIPAGLTAVVTFDGRFHQCFHPFSNDGLGGRIEHMSLVVRMFHLETITSRLDILVGGDLVARNVDVSFDLSLLKSILVSVLGEKTGVCPNRGVVVSHPVEIVPLQYAIPVLPRIIVLSLLHQPAIEIWSSNLLDDAATPHETRSVTWRWRNR